MTSQEKALLQQHIEQGAAQQWQHAQGFMCIPDSITSDMSTERKLALAIKYATLLWHSDTPTSLCLHYSTNEKHAILLSRMGLDGSLTHHGETTASDTKEELAEVIADILLTCNAAVISWVR